MRKILTFFILGVLTLPVSSATGSSLALMELFPVSPVFVLKMQWLRGDTVIHEASGLISSRQIFAVNDRRSICEDSELVSDVTPVDDDCLIGFTAIVALIDWRNGPIILGLQATERDLLADGIPNPYVKPAPNCERCTREIKYPTQPLSVEIGKPVILGGSGEQMLKVTLLPESSPK